MVGKEEMVSLLTRGKRYCTVRKKNLPISSPPRPSQWQYPKFATLFDTAGCDRKGTSHLKTPRPFLEISKRLRQIQVLNKMSPIVLTWQALERDIQGLSVDITAYEPSFSPLSFLQAHTAKQFWLFTWNVAAAAAAASCHRYRRKQSQVVSE